jgi:hypothetical protein
MIDFLFGCMAGGGLVGFCVGIWLYGRRARPSTILQRSIDAAVAREREAGR